MLIKLAQDNSAKKLMGSLVAFLRALYQIHQNAHWRTKGKEFYGNHLLFQRLYEGTQETTDEAAEKTIGLFGSLPEMEDQIAALTEKFHADNFDGDWVQAALRAEQTFQALCKTVYDKIKKLEAMTLGLDDMIMSIASRHEVHIYLLKQVLEGVVKEASEKSVWKDLAKSMKGTKKVIKEHLSHVEKGMPRSHVEEVRDFSGNLALLCNMILNGKEYSRKEKLEAIRDKVAQADPEVEGPNVRIEPMESLVQQAVNRLKQMDPNYFKGVRSIVIASQPHYGFVESGPEKDPTIIHLNYNRIRQEIAAKGGTDEDVINSIVETIAHEKGHVASFQPQQGFVGGEQPAEQEAQRIHGLIQPRTP